MPLPNAGDRPGVPILAYSLASMIMIAANKYCASYPKWNLNIFLLAVQSLVCILAMQTCRVLGFLPQLSDFNLGNVRKWLPVSFLLVGMTYSGIQALQYVTVPLYTVFKSVSIIITAFGEVMWLGGRVRLLALLSFGVMALSCMMIVWSETYEVLGEFNPSGLPRAETEVNAKLSILNLGYYWMALNVAFTSAYVLSMRYGINKTGFNDLDVMFYNNLIAFPILLIGTYTNEDWSALNIKQNFPLESRQQQMLAMVFSGFIAVAVSYTTPWCIRATSPTKYSIVGYLTKAVITVGSLVYYWDPTKQSNISNITLGLLSGLVYSWVKFNEADSAKTILPMDEHTKDLGKGGTID